MLLYMDTNTVDNQSKPEEKVNYGKGYGKRPLWQWILIYVVIGAIAYSLIYYFFLKGETSLLGY